MIQWYQVLNHLTVNIVNYHSSWDVAAISQVPPSRDSNWSIIEGTWRKVHIPQPQYFSGEETYYGNQSFRQNRSSISSARSDVHVYNSIDRTWSKLNMNLPPGLYQALLDAVPTY